MKKNIMLSFLTVCMFLSSFFSAIGQTVVPTKVWTVPAIYKSDSLVTWYFDLKGTNYLPKTTFDPTLQNLYLWAWSPTTPDAGNINNSSDFAKLEYVGDSVWKKTITPTLYFKSTVDEIVASAGYWTRLKGKDISFQSDVIHVPAAADVIVPATTGAPAKVWTVPTNYALNDTVTWYFDMTGTSFADGQNMYLWAWSPTEPDANHFSKSSDFAKLEYVGNMVWKKKLVTTSYFKMSVDSILASTGFWMKIKGLGKALISGTFKMPMGFKTQGTVTSIAVVGESIISSGATSQMSVSLTPFDAIPLPISWSVDDASVAYISSTGLLSPKKNGVVNVTASLLQNGITISNTKQITISNQLTTIYLNGSATINGDNLASALPMNSAPTVNGILSGYFELYTTLTAGTLQFSTTKDLNTATVFGAGATTGSIQSGGAGIVPTSTGSVLVRVDLATNTYKIYPINPLKISQMGSSVSYGWGASSLLVPNTFLNAGYAYQYGQLLNKRYTESKGLNWNLSNISIGGNNTILMLNRWDTDLLNDDSKYVVYALSLGNEGIMSGGQATFDQFKTNMLLLIDKAKSVGKIPVVANAYTNGSYNLTDYAFVKKMNLLIHEWNVSSINLLGAIDDGVGKWPLAPVNYQSDAAHPNDAGHAELFTALVPSLFDALDAGKPQPVVQTGTFISMGKSQSNQQLSFVPENLIHSFTFSVDVKTVGDGIIASFKQGDLYGVLKIDASTGFLSYTSPNGGTIVGQTLVNDGAWHKITLTHYYASQRTILYSDSTAAGNMNEVLLSTDFRLNDVNAPAAIDYRQWFFYRSAMNADEITALCSGKMLKSSLELYAPLDGQAASGNDILNLAQSTNVISKLPLITALDNFKEDLSVVRISPSLVNQKLKIVGLIQGCQYECSIYGLEGRLIAKSSLLNENVLDVSELVSGSYILLIKDKTNMTKVSLSFQKNNMVNN